MRKAPSVWRDPVMVGAFAVLVFVALASLIGPSLLQFGPNDQTGGTPLAPPSAAHLFGTDQLGRDLLARVLAGIRVDLVLIAIAIPISVLIGGALGLLSASNRLIDAPMQRLFDVALAFPALILGIAIAAMISVGIISIVVTICLVNIPIFARVLRGAARGQTARDYVLAERVLGVGKVRLYLRHILPNCLDVVLVQIALAASTTVTLEGALSFLGLGIRPPDPSLGSLLQASLSFLETDPTYAGGPLSVITTLVLCFTLMADRFNRSLVSR